MTAPAWTPEIEERAKEVESAATCGPWSVAEDQNEHNGIPWVVGIKGKDSDGLDEWVVDCRDVGGEGITPDDADFIAAARTIIPSALAEIERLRTVLEDKRTTESAIKVHLGLAAGGTGESLEEEVRKVVAERDRLALDLAEMALAARPGPTAAEMDAADNAAGRRRAIAKRRK